MAELTALLIVSLSAMGAIILTQDIARSPLSCFMLLHSTNTIVIDLLVCIVLMMVIYYALAVRDSRPQPLIDDSVEPRMIRSWVPWVGSGLDYLVHSDTFFRKYSLEYGTAFKFKFFGKTMVAISSPTAASNFLKDYSGAFKSMFNAETVYSLSGINLGDDQIWNVYSALVRATYDPIHRALVPSNMSAISSRFTQDFMKGLDELDLSAPDTSLHGFVHRTIYNASSTAFFGPNFPLNTYDDFMTFECGSPMIARRLGIFARSATAARDAMFAEWDNHIVRNWVSEGNGYLEGAVGMMTDVYRELNQTDLTPKDISRLTGLTIWAIHANVMDLTTWVMCHLLTDKNTYTSACREIRAFVDEKFPNLEDITQIDLKTLESDDLPLLNSLIREVMRTKTNLGATRLATRDTVIRDDDQKAILIRKGEIVSVNIQGMHYSPELHSEPECFKADRFVEEKASYKLYTYGVGKHACAGRNYANFVVRQFVVLILALYDIEVKPNRPGGVVSLPEISQHLNSMIFFRPKDDLSITLHRRVQ